MAALFTRTSMPPSSEDTLSVISCTEALSETSASSAMQRALLDAASSATRSAFSSDWSTAATAAPEAASVAQMPSARPPPPPVTIATRPSREPATREPPAGSLQRTAAESRTFRREPSPCPAPADDDTQAAEPQQICSRYAGGPLCKLRCSGTLMTRGGSMDPRNRGSEGHVVSALGLGCIGKSEFYGTWDGGDPLATFHRS